MNFTRTQDQSFIADSDLEALIEVDLKNIHVLSITDEEYEKDAYFRFGRVNYEQIVNSSDLSNFTLILSTYFQKSHKTTIQKKNEQVGHVGERKLLLCAKGRTIIEAAIPNENATMYANGVAFIFIREKLPGLMKLIYKTKHENESPKGELPTHYNPLGKDLTSLQVSNSMAFRNSYLNATRDADVHKFSAFDPTVKQNITEIFPREIKQHYTEISSVSLDQEFYDILLTFNREDKTKVIDYKKGSEIIEKAISVNQLEEYLADTDSLHELFRMMLSEVYRSEIDFNTTIESGNIHNITITLNNNIILFNGKILSAMSVYAKNAASLLTLKLSYPETYKCLAELRLHKKPARVVPKDKPVHQKHIADDTTASVIEKKDSGIEFIVNRFDVTSLQQLKKNDVDFKQLSSFFNEKGFTLRISIFYDSCFMINLDMQHISRKPDFATMSIKINADNISGALNLAARKFIETFLSHTSQEGINTYITVHDTTKSNFDRTAESYFKCQLLGYEKLNKMFLPEPAHYLPFVEEELDNYMGSFDFYALLAKIMKRSGHELTFYELEDARTNDINFILVLNKAQWYFFNFNKGRALKCYESLAALQCIKLEIPDLYELLKDHL